MRTRGDRPPSPHEHLSETRRRAPIFGPEPWATVGDTDWCHFDCWFAVVIVADFDRAPDALEREFASRLRSPTHYRPEIEAKLSHLSDLRARLTAANLDISDLAAAAPASPALMSKARRKVLSQGLEDRAMSAAMHDTPRARPEQRARYGHWSRFPMSPDRWYDKLVGRRPAKFVPKGRTFALTDDRSTGSAPSPTTRRDRSRDA